MSTIFRPVFPAAVSVNWDDAPGNFDDRAGNFDDSPVGADHPRVFKPTPQEET